MKRIMPAAKKLSLKRECLLALTEAQTLGAQGAGRSFDADFCFPDSWVCPSTHCPTLIAGGRCSVRQQCIEP
jgi:hypothetical protein